MEEEKQFSQEFSEEQEEGLPTPSESFDDSPDRSLNDELASMRKELPYHQRDSVINLLKNDKDFAQEKQLLIKNFDLVYGNIEDTDPEKMAVMLFLSETLGITIPKKNLTLETLSVEDNEK